MIEQVYNLVTKPGVMLRLWFRGRCRKWAMVPYVSDDAVYAVIPHVSRTVYSAAPCRRIRFHRGGCRS